MEGVPFGPIAAFEFDELRTKIEFVDKASF